MPQLSLSFTDEEYEVLVAEAGRRQTQTRKIYHVNKLVGELMHKVIADLNGNMPPTNTPTEDSKQDDEPFNPLADLDI